MDKRTLETIGIGGTPLVYLDLEFTGLDAQIHDIIEIALLLPVWAHQLETFSRPDLLTREIIPGWTAWTIKVHPEDIETASQEALEINGYDPDLWKEAFSIEQAIELTRELTTGVTVAGHNLSLDMEFLRAASKKHTGQMLDLKYKIDTVTLIWEHLSWRGLTKANLNDACTVLGISNEGSHRALPDVLRAKAVLDALLFKVAPYSPPSIYRRIQVLERNRKK